MVLPPNQMPSAAQMPSRAFVGGDPIDELAAIRANKYRYKGKIKEFIKNREKDKAVKLSPKKKIGFNDWKNMLISK